MEIFSGLMGAGLSHTIPHPDDKGRLSVSEHTTQTHARLPLLAETCLFCLTLAASWSALSC